MTEARAIQRSTRQSPYKMRLVIDQIRGKDVNEAVANAEQAARAAGESVDVDNLYIKHAIVNEGTKLKRFTPAAMGRATPMQKRTSHVHIIVAERE
jgi:large subunit ribosomal protein L22